MKPSTTHYPKQHLFVKINAEKKPEGEGPPAPEHQVLHIHYGNITELIAAGQFVTSLDSSGSEASDSMNTTTHTLTTITIIIELSGRGAGDAKDVEGGTRTQRHRNILLHVGLATAGDCGKHEW